jgi:hypothetical protein
MPEYFKSIRAINLSPDRSRAGIDIYFERTDNPPPDNPAVEKLRADYEETMSVLKDMDLPDSDFGTFYNELLVGAQIGLQGPHLNLDAGRSQLNNVRGRLTRRARRERDQYLIRLGFSGGGVALASLLAAALLYSVVPQFLKTQVSRDAFEGFLAWLIPACLLHPGVVLGVVFTAFVLNRTFTFEKIRNFDPYFFPPGLRFFYVSIISYVLLAALWFKVVMLGLGGVLLNDVKEVPAIGLLIGLICGISEALVVELLVSRFRPVEKGNAQH